MQTLRLDPTFKPSDLMMLPLDDDMGLQDGKILIDYKFEDVRARCRGTL